MTEAPQYSERQKNAYWLGIGLSVRDGFRMHRLSGQLAHGPDNWRNVPQHCLVEVARATVLGTWLGLPDSLIAEIKMGSFLHDDRKKQEIIATKQVLQMNISPLAAARSEHAKADDLLSQNGFSERVRRWAGSAGGDVPQLIEAQRILDQKNITDEDLAYLIVHYIDDCSVGSNWIRPSGSSQEGARVNIIDYRMQENKEKQVYSKISQEITEELSGHPVLGKFSNLDAAAFVSHQIEERLALLISANLSKPVDPLMIPEMIDEEIRSQIEQFSL
jgi:hypothetical protein